MVANTAVETYDDLVNAVTGIDNEELNTVLTFDEAATASGLSEQDMVFIASPYTVLNQDKDILLDNPFFIRAIRFATDAETENSYTVFHCVTRANESYVVTDGSTGIFRQLSRVVSQRIADGHPTPFQNVMVPNGLRKSEYGIDAEGKPVPKGAKAVSKAATYYLG
jgi:hypothetical protein